MAHSTARVAQEEQQQTFDVFASDGSNHSFSGDSEVEAKVWLGMIKQVTDSHLNEAILIHSPGEARSALGTVPPELLDMIVAEPENTKCADCCCPDPDWASITFGTFICITCSGIHRSVGTALCSVRSIIYDNWDAAQVSAMKGNKVANAFWESCIPDGVHKPHALSTEEEKNSWFVRKYFKREFVDPTATKADLKRMIHTPASGGFRLWRDHANELLESIHQLQQHYPHVSAYPVTPNLLMARRNSVSDFNRPGAPGTPSSPAIITTSVGKKAKQLKKDKRERSMSKLAARDSQTPSSPLSTVSNSQNTSTQSAPAQISTNLQPRELEASKRYASNPTLLKEALLFLISEDDHFKRQLRLILREPTQPGAAAAQSTTTPARHIE